MSLVSARLPACWRLRCRISVRSASCSPKPSRPPTVSRSKASGSGGNALHEIRFGLMPQVLPVIAGQVLYFIESNTRSATIIGIVGAGGIGLQLAEQIRVLEWQ